MHEAIDAYKSKANEYRTKLEETEIARAKAERAESIGESNNEPFNRC